MIVGETYMALDRVHIRPHEAYSGSPLLLQIWLQEHLAIICRPSDVPNYMAKGFPSRRRSISYSSQEEWAAFLRGRFVVRFRIAWWHLKSMVGGNESVNHMRLLGLTRATFFLPHRVKRQYGLAQWIPSRDDAPPEEHDLSSRYIEGWQKYWAKGVRWTAPRIKDSAYTTEYYREWMTCHDAGKRSYLRQLEDDELSGRPTPTQGVVIREPSGLPPRRREGKGKGKEKEKESEKPPKKGRRDDGSSSGK